MFIFWVGVIMKKVYLLIFLFFFLPFNCLALEFPNLNSNAVVVFDKTDDKVLYSYNNNEIKSVASLTKIVTTIVSIEKISNLDDEVVITYDVINSVDPVASKAGLKVGDIVTYRDLLYASILPSGADATNALAISLSGSIDNFVIEMNNFVNKLDLKNTHFVNVTGLDVDGHYSTANDIMKILNYSLDNSLFYDIFTTKEYTLKNGLEVKSTLYKYNGDDINQILGSKTGFTGNAGYCIATLNKTDGHDIIIVLLGANHIDDKYYNIVDSVNLVDFINNNYSNILLSKKGTIIKKIPIELSKTSSYSVESNTDIYKFLPVDYDSKLFKVEFIGKTKLNYKDDVGSRVGKINYYYDEEKIFTEDVYLSQKIEISYLKILKKYLIYEIIGFLFFIGLVILLLFWRKKSIGKNVIEVSY